MRYGIGRNCRTTEVFSPIVRVCELEDQATDDVWIGFIGKSESVESAGR